MSVTSVTVVCSKCSKPAEYDSPADLCRRHWAEWWVEAFDYTDPVEREREIAYVLAEIAAQAAQAARAGE